MPDDTDVEQVTEEQVEYALEFAKHLNNIYPGIYNPMLVNQRLQDITLNPLQGTIDDIEKALASPKDNEQKLIGYGQNLELTDMLYKRNILYLANLPAWDLTFSCTNATKKEEYKTPAYKKDEKILADFIHKFDIKKEFSKVLKQMLRNETYYGVMRTDGEQYVMQELPQKYCIVTSAWEYGLIFDFNMMYFIANPGVSLDQFPPVFKKYYKRALDVVNKKLYDPGVKVENRNGSWVYWVQTDPSKDNVWCWKFNPELFSNIPFFAGLFPDLALRPLIRKLQKNSYIQQATKILIATIGMQKDQKSGSVKDAFQISPEVAGQFANLLRQGLAQEISFGIGPWEDLKSFEFKSDTTGILDQYNKVTIGQSGSNARLLYTTDKMNLTESKASISIDEQLVLALMPEFESFLNFNINKLTRKYKFKIVLEGTNMPDNRQKRFDDAMELAQVGIVLPQKISSAMGMNYFDMKSQMEMANADGFVESLTPLLTSYTMNSKDSKGGRPEKSDGKLTDAGGNTKDSGANEKTGGD